MSNCFSSHFCFPDMLNFAAVIFFTLIHPFTFILAIIFISLGTFIFNLQSVLTAIVGFMYDESGNPLLRIED